MVKEQIQDLYLNGYNLYEITEITNESEVLIQKVIDMELKDKFKVHNENRNLRIVELFKTGFKPRKIASILGMDFKDVNDYINKNFIEYKSINKENFSKYRPGDDIYKLYIQGRTCNQIAIELNKNTSTVNSHINRHLKDYKKIHLENRTKEVKRLYEMGYVAREIAEQLDERVDTVRYQIHKKFKDSRDTHRLNKEKNRPGDKIKDLYVKGYNVTEISKVLKLDKNNVKMHVSRNLSSFKDQHDKVRKENEEIKRVVSKASKNYMNDYSLLKMNRQSYDYDKNYDLVFNEKSRGIRPCDLPNKYKKEVI